MGCDIHMHVEYQPWTPNQGFWHFVDVSYTPRDYSLFGAIAGVRDTDIEPVAKPKGLPDRLSPGVAEEYKKWEVDAHSMTWLTLAELEEALHRVESEHREYRAVVAIMRELGPTARVVIWFDN
jgi:hypothetical protein